MDSYWGWRRSDAHAVLATVCASDAHRLQSPGSVTEALVELGRIPRAVIVVGGVGIRRWFGARRIRFQSVDHDVPGTRTGVRPGRLPSDRGIHAAIRVAAGSGTGHLHRVRNFRDDGIDAVLTLLQRADGDRPVAPREWAGRESARHAYRRDVRRPIDRQWDIERRRERIGQDIRRVGIVRSPQTAAAIGILGQRRPERIRVAPRVAEIDHLLGKEAVVFDGPPGIPGLEGRAPRECLRFGLRIDENGDRRTHCECGKHKNCRVRSIPLFSEVHCHVCLYLTLYQNIYIESISTPAMG